MGKVLALLQMRCALLSPMEGSNGGPTRTS
jgi:hypothetical protein